MQQKLNNAAGSGDKDDFSDGLSLLASGLVELESLLTQAESLGGEPQE